MEKLTLANLPTKIEKLERLSEEFGTNLYIKRDDHTGSEISGNKVRKLEYLAKDAQDNGYNLLITCGGIQSNHCRATVAVATKLGMKSAVLLRISEQPPVVGNYFLDKLMGADVKFCTRPEYSNSRGEIMEAMAEEYRKQGYKPYVIPEGASNELGTLGYYNCMNEIVAQEKEMGITFDTVVVATGSGGTAAGLYLANELHGYGKRVVSMAVCDDVEYFTNIIDNISNGALEYLPEYKGATLKRENIEVIDKYVGLGYAISRPEELEFIKHVAQKEAVILDPVYTGKAMYGVYNELKEGGALVGSKNILFIHTGGMFGLFPVSEQFEW
ncbi:MAG: D-cysteine desulfhydrase family protein [Bacteroidales bacterium]|nr:D-cysteine desulfhydrase family protein [Bacteroidales bacterium]